VAYITGMSMLQGCINWSQICKDNLEFKKNDTLCIDFLQWQLRHHQINLSPHTGCFPFHVYFTSSTVFSCSCVRIHKISKIDQFSRIFTESTGHKWCNAHSCREFTVYLYDNYRIHSICVTPLNSSIVHYYSSANNPILMINFNCSTPSNNAVCANF